MQVLRYRQQAGANALEAVQMAAGVGLPCCAGRVATSQGQPYTGDSLSCKESYHDVKLMIRKKIWLNSTIEVQMEQYRNEESGLKQKRAWQNEWHGGNGSKGVAR